MRFGLAGFALVALLVALLPPSRASAEHKVEDDLDPFEAMPGSEDKKPEQPPLQHYLTPEQKTMQAVLDKMLEFHKQKALEDGVIADENGIQYMFIHESAAGRRLGFKPTEKYFANDLLSDAVKVRFKGTLIDGKKIDTTFIPGDEDHAISDRMDHFFPGLQFALKQMYIGDKLEAYIPWHHAYGQAGTDNTRTMRVDVPPFHSVVYRIHLLDVHSQRKQNPDWKNDFEKGEL